MSPTPSTSSGPDHAAAEDDASLYRKVSWHILPLLLLAYAVSYLDRSNISFAQLQMQDALGFNAATFGMGAGIMFLGYFLFEVPSNILLEHIGARKTFLRITVLWGVTASATMFVTTPLQFYVARFLLGVFEAGFFPGVILYLTYWYPPARRGRMVAIFSVAPVAAAILAGPLCGATLKFMNGLGGLAGWQWLYLTQGLPAVVLGLVLYAMLNDRPEPCAWLTDSECERIRRNLGEGGGSPLHPSAAKFLIVLRMPRVWALALVSFLTIGGQYALVFWIPTLIKGWGVSDPLQIGLYITVPSLLGAIAMVVVGRSSDRWLERRWHFAFCCALSVTGLFALTLTQGRLLPSMIALCVTVMGMAAATPVLTTADSEYLPVQVIAPGIAFITSCGILGAAVWPAITGTLIARSGSPVPGLYLIMGLIAAAVVLLLQVLPPRRAGMTLSPPPSGQDLS